MKLIFILLLLILSLSAWADFSPEDKIQLQNQLTSFEDALSKGDIDFILHKLSSHAREGLQEELDAALRGNKIAFRQDISSMEELGSNQVKVEGKFYARGKTESGVRLKVNGLSDYYIFEKSGEDWLLVDTNFHQIFDEGYVFKLISKLFLIIFVISIPLMIFWIWMLVDAVKRKFENKVAWIVILALTGFIGALIYYFAVRRAAKQREKNIKVKRKA